MLAVWRRPPFIMLQLRRCDPGELKGKSVGSTLEVFARLKTRAVPIDGGARANRAAAFLENLHHVYA
jgi:hypothetical protein